MSEHSGKDHELAPLYQQILERLAGLSENDMTLLYVVLDDAAKGIRKNDLQGSADDIRVALRLLGADGDTRIEALDERGLEE